jgi:hypothetical protein
VIGNEEELVSYARTRKAPSNPDRFGREVFSESNSLKFFDHPPAKGIEGLLGKPRSHDNEFWRRTGECWVCW